jgi:hypothetical protein
MPNHLTQVLDLKKVLKIFLKPTGLRIKYHKSALTALNVENNIMTPMVLAAILAPSHLLTWRCLLAQPRHLSRICHPLCIDWREGWLQHHISCLKEHDYSWLYVLFLLSLYICLCRPCKFLLNYKATQHIIRQWPWRYNQNTRKKSFISREMICKPNLKVDWNL